MLCGTAARWMSCLFTTIPSRTTNKSRNRSRITNGAPNRPAGTLSLPIGGHLRPTGNPPPPSGSPRLKNGSHGRVTGSHLQNGCPVLEKIRRRPMSGNPDRQIGTPLPLSGGRLPVNGILEKWIGSHRPNGSHLFLSGSPLFLIGSHLFLNGNNRCAARMGINVWACRWRVYQNNQCCRAIGQQWAIMAPCRSLVY